MYALILAAGEGKRMKSKIPKVIHKVCGMPMISHVIDSARESKVEEFAVVIGHGADMVKNQLGDGYNYIYQKEQLGTGHAVMQAVPFLEHKQGYVVVLYGDTPLITSDIISHLIEFTVNKGYNAGVLTAELDNPAGYGRIISDENNYVKAIVEDRDADYKQKLIKQINTGIYCFKIPDLLKCLNKLNNDNAQREYYLTDVIGIMNEAGLKVGACKTRRIHEVEGVNDRVQLASAERFMRYRILEQNMLNGVTIIDPDNTYIGKYCEIGQDAIIYPGNVIEGQTSIGEGCILFPNNRIEDSIIEPFAKLQCSVILESKIGENSTVGPYAYVRPGSNIGTNVRIGDFVEIKNSSIEDYTKVSHLTYVGDADVGKNGNIGCGVVFVNYDGRKKHRTTVGDNAFIGCNVNLVAPVTVGDNSYIAAGSTITEDVSEYSLAIARARQTIKPNWAKNKYKK
ncbi:MAG: bifunctional UDP-N-acetylglucosamine diphosphorylase/glucosamine-1-phosphate N-acetyltransferase GlmU [Clostridia bacterium]|nr:bifunctional UDP-N-acetylglucosamine diphosphorylase/glucosamine-1-phosphate N-acetyltransferase GlmU [Clostridia bacterium]